MRRRYFSLIERFLFLQGRIKLLRLSRIHVTRPIRKTRIIPIDANDIRMIYPPACHDEIFFQRSLKPHLRRLRYVTILATYRSLLASSNSRHARISIKLNWIERYRSLWIDKINNPPSVIGPLLLTFIASL